MILKLKYLGVSSIANNLMQLRITAKIQWNCNIHHTRLESCRKHSSFQPCWTDSSLITSHQLVTKSLLFVEPVD
jgi:hypothetical protein